MSTIYRNSSLETSTIQLGIPPIYHLSLRPKEAKPLEDPKERALSLLTSMQNSGLFVSQNTLLEELSYQEDIGFSLKLLLRSVIDPASAVTNSTELVYFEDELMEILESILPEGVDLAEFLEEPFSSSPKETGTAEKMESSEATPSILDKMTDLSRRIQESHLFSEEELRIVQACERRLAQCALEEEGERQSAALILCHLLSSLRSTPTIKPFEIELLELVQDILGGSSAEEFLSAFYAKQTRRQVEERKHEILAYHTELMQEEEIDTVNQIYSEANQMHQALLNQVASVRDGIEKTLIGRIQKTDDVNAKVDALTKKISDCALELKKSTASIEAIRNREIVALNDRKKNVLEYTNLLNGGIENK